MSIAVSLLGQASTITGTVLDSEKKTPIPGVTIQLLDANAKILAYTFSKNNGIFSLPYSDKSAVLSFKCMGYRSHTVSISKNTSPLEIFLVEEATQLRDVIVKAPAIERKSDTIVYEVQRFADAQDRTIADVLKKMPGIEIAENGEIKYNGEPINKFYIEGNDLLEGRYGLASNNISHKDVQRVEVMENHQPIRVLQNIEYSDQAALNLRLKEDAKLRWSGTVNGGTGFSPALYDASLFAMRIAKKIQSIETVRVNNTGWNPASQSIRYTSDNLLGASAPNYIAVGGNTTPLEQQRTRFNRSLFVNTTNSARLNENYNLKANLTYERDKLKTEQFAHTDYFDSAIRPFSETETVHTDAHSLSGQVILQANTTKTYLKNNFSADFVWRDALSGISGLSETGQNAEMPTLTVANDLQIAKRIRNQIFTIGSSNSFVHKPHLLSVENEAQIYNQDITFSAFQSTTEASYGWIFTKWQVRGRAGFNYNYNELKTGLTGINTDEFPTINNSRLSRMNIYVRPDFTYDNKRLRLNLSALINQYLYDFNDRLDERSTKAYTIISPAFQVGYKFSACLEILANARYTVTPPRPNLYYTGAIMNNYRYLSLGYPIYDTDTRTAADVSLRYRDPITSFFANIGSSYEKGKASFINNQIFIDEQILITYVPLSNSNTVFRINGGLSKGVFYGKIYIGIDAGYVQATSSTMRNTIAVPYRLSTVSVIPKIKGTLAKWIAIEYSLLAGRNTMNFSDNTTVSAYDNLKQKLNVSLLPVRKLQVYIGGEHYLTQFNDNTSDHLLLLDAGVKWAVSDKIDVSLSAINLMDEHYYSYSLYGSLSETMYRYRIRPRNILASVQVRF